MLFRKGGVNLSLCLVLCVTLLAVAYGICLHGWLLAVIVYTCGCYLWVLC